MNPNDLKVAEANYHAFTRLIKVAIPVIAAIVAFVILMITR